MLKTLFNKVAILKALLKTDVNTGVFCEIFKIFKNTFILENSSSGYFWRLTRIFKGVQRKTGATVRDKYQIQLEKSICCSKNQYLSEEDKSWIFFLLLF